MPWRSQSSVDLEFTKYGSPHLGYELGSAVGNNHFGYSKDVYRVVGEGFGRLLCRGIFSAWYRNNPLCELVNDDKTIRVIVFFIRRQS